MNDPTPGRTARCVISSTTSLPEIAGPTAAARRAGRAAVHRDKLAASEPAVGRPDRSNPWQWLGVARPARRLPQPTGNQEGSRHLTWDNRPSQVLDPGSQIHQEMPRHAVGRMDMWQ